MEVSFLFFPLRLIIDFRGLTNIPTSPPFLICRDTVSIDITASDTVTPSCHFIPTVAFYGIDGSSADTLYNSNVVNRSIISPVKENNISCHRGITSVPEPALTFKPSDTVRTTGKFRNDSTTSISHLIFSNYRVFW